MQATFVQEGNSIDYTPTVDVAAGEVVVQGELVGVAKRPIAANKTSAIAVTGLFDFPKATGVGTAISVGAKVYWDNTAKVATADDATGTNKLLGKTVLVTTDADDKVRVLLSQ